MLNEILRLIGRYEKPVEEPKVEKPKIKEEFRLYHFKYKIKQ